MHILLTIIHTYIHTYIHTTYQVQRLLDLDASTALQHKQQMEAVNATMKEQQDIKAMEIQRYYSIHTFST